MAREHRSSQLSFRHVRQVEGEEVWPGRRLPPFIGLLLHTCSAPGFMASVLPTFFKGPFLVFAGRVHSIQQSIAGWKGNAEQTLMLMHQLRNTSWTRGDKNSDWMSQSLGPAVRQSRMFFHVCLYELFSSFSLKIIFPSGWLSTLETWDTKVFLFAFLKRVSELKTESLESGSWICF